MRIVPVTEEEALKQLPESFEDLADEEEVENESKEEAEHAAIMLLDHIKKNPEDRFLKIELD